MISVVALVVALGSGVLMGMFGSGGSMLIVPLLVHLVGMEPHAATTASMVVVGLTSLIACIQHALSGDVRMRIAGVFAVGGIPGAYLGGHLSQSLQPAAQMVLFAITMIVLAMGLLRKRKSDAAHEPSPAKILPLAFGLGLLTGTLGIGGGVLIVPTLLLFGGVPLDKAAGTSLVIITINCASGLVQRLPSGSIPWETTLEFAVVSVSGTFVGHAIAKRASVVGLRRLFAMFVLGLGLLELALNVPV